MDAESGVEGLLPSWGYLWSSLFGELVTGMKDLVVLRLLNLLKMAALGMGPLLQPHFESLESLKVVP